LNDPTSQAYFENFVGNTVLFDVDGFTLNSSAKAALDIQAEWLLSNPGYVIVLEGHADERGTREYNLALGFRRAQSVQEYLVARGVSGLRLKTRSYGKERPVEICSSERCYEKNRRTVTILSQSLS
jgi:peptidoglycan-associated lipoprotein